MGTAGSGGRLFGRCPAWRWAGHGRGAVRSPRGRAALARPLCARPGPPALPGEDPVPGRWVKNRTERHLAPGSCGGHRTRQPVPRDDSAGILICPRCHMRHQLPRVPGAARYVTILPHDADAPRAARACKEVVTAAASRRRGPGSGRGAHGRGTGGEACVKQRPPAASGACGCPPERAGERGQPPSCPGSEKNGGILAHSGVARPVTRIARAQVTGVLGAGLACGVRRG
jgi:hypothetical protein